MTQKHCCIWNNARLKRGHIYGDDICFVYTYNLQLSFLICAHLCLPQWDTQRDAFRPYCGVSVLVRWSFRTWHLKSRVWLLHLRLITAQAASWWDKPSSLVINSFYSNLATDMRIFMPTARCTVLQKLSICNSRPFTDISKCLALALLQHSNQSLPSSIKTWSHHLQQGCPIWSSH